MRTLLWLVLVVSAGVGGWCLHVWQSSSGPASAAHTAKVTKSELAQTVKARGIVKPAPNSLVRLGFPMPKDVSRRIKTMNVVEGDAVNACKVLAELDHDDLKGSLHSITEQ